MNWKDQLNKALGALRDVAESEKAKDITAKAKETATNLAQRVKEGALGAAEAFVEANSDPSTMRFHFLNADLSIVSPADGIEITRPNAGTIVVDDGAGNGLVINAAAEKPYVAETIGTVKRLNDTTYDLGAEDAINVVVLKD